MSTVKKRSASQIVANFLKQSENNISCIELTGGSEEETLFKCSYQTVDYVIKFFTNIASGISEIAWTKHASNLSIGPKLFYASPSEDYMIVEFAKGNSLVPETANSPTIIKAIATNLAKLHGSSAAFAHESDMFKRIDIKYKKLQCSGKLKDILEHGWQQFKKIEAQVKDFEVPLVPCHNDLNWGNIFVKNNTVTLIDWGDAALGNLYFDIAAFFVLNVIEPKNQKLFFEQYNPELLKPQWQTYLQLLKQLVYFEFALNLLLGVQTSKSELLYAHDIPPVKPLSSYLTLLAKKEIIVDSVFLYNMAIAALTML